MRFSSKRNDDREKILEVFNDSNFECLQILLLTIKNVNKPKSTQQYSNTFSDLNPIIIFVLLC